MSRSRAQRWIRDGAVTDRRRCPSCARRGRSPDGDTVECRPEETAGRELTRGAERRAARDLCEDEHLIVLDKTPDVAVHPGAGRADRTLVNFLLDRFPEIATVGHPRRPGDRPSARSRHLGRARGGAHRAGVPAPDARLRRARGGQALPRDRLRAPRSAERRDRRRHRPRSQGSQADDGEGARTRRAHALPHRSPSALDWRCSSSTCAPAAPTRSACTSRAAASPSSAIRSTARRAGARFRRSGALACDVPATRAPRLAAHPAPPRHRSVAHLRSAGAG